MNRYRLTVSLDFEAADDPAAREILLPLREIVVQVRPFVASAVGLPKLKLAKLQRLYDDRSPRALLAHEERTTDAD